MTDPPGNLPSRPRYTMFNLHGVEARLAKPVASVVAESCSLIVPVGITCRRLTAGVCCCTGPDLRPLNVSKLPRKNLLCAPLDQWWFTCGSGCKQAAAHLATFLLASHVTYTHVQWSRDDLQSLSTLPFGSTASLSLNRAVAAQQQYSSMHLISR